MDIKIVEMIPEDWKSVSQIYLKGIETGLATFQTNVPSYDEWDKGHILKCRLVAKKDDEVLGWAALSPVSSRSVYSGVAEVSIYIHPEYKGLQIGFKLLKALVDQSESEGFWTLQASITRENIPSIKLHEKCGFRIIGYREKIAKMPSGKWHDTILMERRSELRCQSF